MRRAVLVLVLLMLTGSAAQADYVEVRRSATLKSEPSGDAEVLAQPVVGVNLPLIENNQTNGYYHARHTDGTTGWIYRTLVRRYPGNPPSDEGSTTPIVTHSSTATVGIPIYNRSDWDHWEDYDDDCIDVRGEVLIEESLIPVTMRSNNPCLVESGQWDCAYTGLTFTDTGDLQIDHMVPLKNAHLSGAWAWDDAQREAYANDRVEPNHLIAVQGSANQSKGARGPEAWKPPNEDYWCEYALNWLAIKERWGLTLTAAEVRAVMQMLETCGP